MTHPAESAAAFPSLPVAQDLKHPGMRAPDPTGKMRVVPITPGVILSWGWCEGFLLFQQLVGAAGGDEREQAASWERQSMQLPGLYLG